MNYLVSIVMPVFNGENYIESSINSIISQTYDHWELLVVDDCSTDETQSVVKRLCEVDNRIVSLGLSENSGAAIARNLAVSIAKGRFLAFCDSDDFWYKDKLERQVEFILANQCDAICCGYRRKDFKTGRTLGVIKPPSNIGFISTMIRNRIGTLTVLYDTSSVGKMTFKDIKKRQDYLLWLSILKSGKTFRGMEDILADYSVRSGSISSNKFSLIQYNYNVYRELKFSRICSFLIFALYLLVYFCNKLIQYINGYK